MVVLVIVFHQQVVEQASPKHPQEGHHIGCLCVGEEDAGQESKGDKAVAPYKEEDDLEAIVGEAEELEVYGRANNKKNGNVAAVDEEEPGVLNDPVGAVAQPMHLHHNTQPGTDRPLTRTCDMRQHTVCGVRLQASLLLVLTAVVTCVI